MSTLEQAIALAAHYHAGQRDKGGQPYILHPLAVMARVEGEEAKTVAVLHDIIEDTPLTAKDLRARGFSETVVKTVAALTRTRGESRAEAARRVAKNPLARMVKLADLAENMNLARIKNPTAQDIARMEEYRAVKAILES